MSKCTDNTGKFLQVKKVKSREVDWLTTCHLKSGTSEFITRVTAPMSQHGVSEFSLFPLWFVHPNWENEKQSRYWMGKTHLDNPCKWEELFSKAPSFLQRHGWISCCWMRGWNDTSISVSKWWHFGVDALSFSCRKKTKCSGSAWDSITWSAPTVWKVGSPPRTWGLRWPPDAYISW